MLALNFPVLALAALVPLLTGFIWYNKALFGKAWMKESGISEESAKNANMPLVFGLTYVFSFLAAGSLNFMTIHQWSIFSILSQEPGLMEAGTEVNTYFMDFMAKYGQHFRTFKHGLFHGILGGFLLATPVLAINALFEQKSFKYIAINAGYWMITLGLMGGIVCQWS